MSRLVRFVAASTVLLAACSTATATDDDVLVTGLCNAIAAPDPETAGDVFARRAHGALHELADSLGDRDRDLATDLLRAKHAVEAAMRDGPADQVRPRLEHLLGRARAGLERVGQPAPACP